METAIATRPLEAFIALRPLLHSIAYRMLGSAMEAEDVVQEAYLRWQGASDTDVRSHRAYFVTIVTRLSINHLRSARAQRETYVGPWLPEPVVTEHVPDLSWRVELAESLSMAFLVLLERLSPIERAVFLLHDAFEFEYAEIAAIVEKSEANCRQILARAKKHIGVKRSSSRSACSGVASKRARCTPMCCFARARIWRQFASLFSTMPAISAYSN